MPSSHLKKSCLFVISGSLWMKYPDPIINQNKHIPDTGIMGKSQINTPTKLIKFHIHRQDIGKDLS